MGRGHYLVRLANSLVSAWPVKKKLSDPSYVVVAWLTWPERETPPSREMQADAQTPASESSNPSVRPAVHQGRPTCALCQRQYLGSKSALSTRVRGVKGLWDINQTVSRREGLWRYWLPRLSPWLASDLSPGWWGYSPQQIVIYHIHNLVLSATSNITSI